MFTVKNETDGVYATPDSFNSQREALAFARGFRRRFAAQDYYLTASGDRIPVEAVELVVVEVDGQNTG